MFMVSIAFQKSSSQRGARTHDIQIPLKFEETQLRV